MTLRYRIPLDPRTGSSADVVSDIQATGRDSTEQSDVEQRARDDRSIVALH